MKLTKAQIEMVKGEVIAYAEMNLGCDNEEAKIIAKDYLSDIVADIEETADWSNLNDDEVCLGDGDIYIAIGRCLADYEETDEDNYDMD